jgi:fibronectin-binding autotransporter adhesin
MSLELGASLLPALKGPRSSTAPRHDFRVKTSPMMGTPPMKSRIALAAVLVCMLTTISFAQTFNKTSGGPWLWTDDSNWDTPHPDAPSASATVPSATTGPTGDLTIDLNDEITIGTLTVNKPITDITANVELIGSATNKLVFDGGGTFINGSVLGSTGTSLTTISAPVVLNSTLTVGQAHNSAVQFLGEISGSGGLNLNRTGTGGAVTRTVVLGAANTYGGNTILTGSTGNTDQNFLLVRLDDAESIPTASNITMQNAVILGLNYGGNFTRGIGTGAGTFHNGVIASGDAIAGRATGWAAFGTDAAVNIYGDSRTVFWGSATGTDPPLGLNQSIMVLGHATADKTVDFQNTLNLNSGGGNTGARTFRINDGAAAIDAKISGSIITSGGSFSDVEFLGGGTVSLTAENTYASAFQASPVRTGATTISGGTVVRLDHANALTPNGNLILTGNGILGLGTDNPSFTRPLGNNTALTGQVQFTTGGGFAAFGGDKFVNLGGAGATVTWDVAPFITTNGSLTLGVASSDGTLDFQNSINLGAAGNDRTILAGGGSAMIDGEVSGVISGAGNLRKNQPGTLEISNVNTYTGTTLINAGVLLLTNQFSIPGGIEGGNTNNIVFTATNANNIGVLGLGERNLTSAVGTGANQVNLGTHAGFAAYFADRVVNLGGAGSQLLWAGTPGFVAGVLQLGTADSTHTLDFQNAIDLNGGTASRTVKVQNGTAVIDGTLSGVISGSGAGADGSGLLGFVKDGGGTLAVSSANTYSGGTSVIQGRLLVNNASGSGTGTGPVNVDAGTLGGTGSISGAVTVSSGAHIAPGASIESLDVSSLTLSSGSILDFELGAPGTSDLLNVTATNGLTINGGTLNLFDGGGLAAGSYTLIDYAGALQGTGISAFLSQTPVGPAGFTYSLSNTGSTIDLNVAAIAVNDADFNGDGIIDAADYVVWRKFNPATGTGTQETGDANGDTNVDELDYDEWVETFGSASPGGGGSGAVPEPCALALLTIAALLMPWRNVRWIRN